METQSIRRTARRVDTAPSSLAGVAAESGDRCPARARGADGRAASAAERLDVAGAGHRGANGATSRRLDVAGAPGGPGRSRRAHGGAEATGWALRRSSLTFDTFLITRPEEVHVSPPYVGPHTPQAAAVQANAAKLLAVRRGDNLHDGSI